MKLIIFLSVFALSLSCSRTLHQQNRKIGIVYKIPYLHTADSMAIVTDSLIQYTSKSQVLYSFPSVLQTFDEANGWIETPSVGYIGYSLGKASGYLFDNYREVRTADVDSFFRSKNYFTIKDSIPLHSAWIKDSINEKGNLLRIYKLRDTALQTAIFTFDKNFNLVDKWSVYDSAAHAALTKVDVWLTATPKNRDLNESFRKISYQLTDLPFDKGDSLAMKYLDSLKILDSRK